MKRFAALYTALDGTTSTNEKLEALIAYFSAAEPEDAPGRRTFSAAANHANQYPHVFSPSSPASAPACRNGCSKSRTRRSAIWPKPSPISCRPRNAHPNSAWRNGSRSAC